MKYFIQIVIGVLIGHTALAVGYTAPKNACYPDNTVCTNIYEILDGLHDGDRASIAANIPNKQQLKFKSKFRVPGSLTAHLQPPQQILYWVPASVDKIFQPPTKYWMAPFYYIFLFRLTLF